MTITNRYNKVLNHVSSKFADSGSKNFYIPNFKATIFFLIDFIFDRVNTRLLCLEFRVLFFIVHKKYRPAECILQFDIRLSFFLTEFATHSIWQNSIRFQSLTFANLSFRILLARNFSLLKMEKRRVKKREIIFTQHLKGHRERNRDKL